MPQEISSVPGHNLVAIRTWGDRVASAAYAEGLSAMMLHFSRLIFLNALRPAIRSQVKVATKGMNLQDTRYEASRIDSINRGPQSLPDPAKDESVHATQFSRRPFGRPARGASSSGQQFGNRMPSRAGSAAQGSSSSLASCFYCKKQGHVIADCRARQAANAKSGGPSRRQGPSFASHGRPRTVNAVDESPVEYVDDPALHFAPAVYSVQEN
jgi:hypothetical protein